MTDSRFYPIIPLAQASHRKWYPRGPFVSINLVQWAVESAYGTRLSGRNNPFGIKANAEQIQNNQFTTVWTKEFIGGVYRSMLLHFADYDSLESAFDAHASLLVHPWYHDCISAPTPQAYAHALQHDGYATAPNYATVLISIMDSNDLYKFDQKG